MTVRIGKRRAASADRELQAAYESNDDPLVNRAAETAVGTAQSLFEEEEDKNLSNDDGCVPTPANVGSTLVTYEYDLAIMPGADKVKAVAQVDAHLPVRIAQELGIWCDEDEEQPANRRALADGSVGIYKVTPGEPDLVRTDAQCESKRFGLECVPVKASLGVQYDADVTTAEKASEYILHHISNLMEHEIIRTKNSQASYVGPDRPFGDRPAYGGAGGSGGIVSSTVGVTGESSGNSGGMTVVGKSLLSVFSVLAVLLAFLALKRRRGNRQELDEDTDNALAPAPEKPLEASRSGSDGTLDDDVDMDFSQSFEAAVAEAEAEAEAADIVADIQRTGSLITASGVLPVVHEDFDPSFESEV